MITSKQLADLLRQQAQANNNAGQITLNDAVLGTSNVDNLVTRDLLRADGTLFLQVDPAQIPVDPPAGGFSIDAAVPSGASGFLNLDNRDAVVAFTFGSTIDFGLTIDTRQTSSGAAVPWVFSTSFPELTFEPFDDLDLTAPQLDFATSGGAGLIFAGDLAPGTIFTALESLMGLSGTFNLNGALVRDAKGNLSFTLKAGLRKDTFPIGTFITLESPYIGVAFAQTTAADGSVNIQVQLCLGATVKFGAEGGSQVVLDLLVEMPLGTWEAPILRLVVVPKPFTTSLSKLGSLIADKTVDDFFSGAPQEIKDLFDTFGFLGYTMNFSTSGKVTALSLSVGTFKPWKLWSDYTLTLDANLSVIFLSDTSVETITLHAGFAYENEGNTMAFDVTVELPSLRISGQQSGPPISFTLTQAIDKLFGSDALNVPDDLLEVSVGDFTIAIDRPANTFSIGMVANVSISLFDTQILALHDMAISVLVNAKDPKKKIYTGTIDGQISLGPITAQVDAVLSNDPTTGCTFTVHLVNETVGSMLGHLVHLVDPTYDISLDEPWDKLLDISLDALVLKVDITNKAVSIDYTADIDLGFLQITELGLSWKKNASGPSTTKIEISGSLLGVQFGTGSSNPPLAWDPVNENPPAVPGGGDKIFDLEYIGIGQHVSFGPAFQPTNVEDVIGKLEQLALPAGGSNLPNLVSKDGLQFDKDSSWLIGADFTILQTLRLAVVFNDPNLYGLLIELSGARAKSLAGLKFEILYRKVTDTIGVYHIELKLPDAMRHIEMGEVSLTLPVIILDIYTNGNFRVDFGFPKGLDFSNSFCLQVFPFLGYGGFYFALLDGDTSSRVPKITNGRFSPVIEFGIALSVGVGKTIDEGILSGGVSVTVVGILEGVIGWFNPTDAAVPKDEYYWLQGTIAITGVLFGSINFVIIQATVSVTAYASVSLLIEAHQPILIAMSVGVTVEVSVKIVFFTIHLSFSATISASFSIGSASATPWVVDQSAGGAPQQLSAPRGLRSLPSRSLVADQSSVSHANQLFAQRGSLHVPQRRVFAALSRHESLAAMSLRLSAGDVVLQWTARTVFATPRAITLHAMPAFTKVNGGVATILLLGIENGIDARASSLAAHVATSTADSTPGVADVLEGLTRWAIANARASLGKPVNDDLVDAEDVALLSRAFADDATLAAAVDYVANLLDFLNRNFVFSLQSPPVDDNGGDTGVSIFPMPPVLKMTAGDNAPIDFASFNSFDDTTLAKMQAYFELLAVDYEKFVADQNGGTDDTQPEVATATTAATPITQVILEQYVAMQLRAVVKACGDVMQRYVFTATQAFGLAEIRTQLVAPGLSAAAIVPPNRDKALLAAGTELVLNGVHHLVRLTDSFASVATAFNAVLPANAQITAQQIATQNVNTPALFITGTSVTFSGLSWTTLQGETLNIVLARLAVRASATTFVQGFPGLQPLAQSILAANTGLFPAGTDPFVALSLPIDPGTQISLPSSAAFVSYETVPEDTLFRIAAYSIAIKQTTVNLPAMLAFVLANNNLTVIDPNAAQPAGTVILLPPVVHDLEIGETIGSLATRLLTDTGSIVNALLAVPATTNLLAPHSLLALPQLTYAVAPADTFGSIAAQFNLTLTALEAAISGPNPVQIFAPNASVIVADITEMNLDQLVAGLAATQWKTIAPMASRFMLSGLRLPDPNNATFQQLILAQMQDPTVLAELPTLPFYQLTGQQFSITSPPAAGYTIAFDPSVAVSWLPVPQTLRFGLTPDQINVIAELAGATFTPAVGLDALPLFRLASARFTLQKHIAWQPAVLPAGVAFEPLGQNVAGNPDLWLFPDSLVEQLQQNGTPQPPYTIAIGTHENADGMTVSNAQFFAWATMLRFSVQQLPADEAGTPAAATILGVVGTDDNGIALLDALDAQLKVADEDATIYLLYPTSPTSSAAGLLSDQLTAQTALMQVNLSTLSSSGHATLSFERSPALLHSETGEPVHVAPITNAAAFLRLVRDCSIVRSGGYYLEYVNANGNVGLPGSLFTNGPVAELTLLVALKSQNAPHAAILPFNNCAIVGDNIDPSNSNVFVEPPTWLVPETSSLSDAVAFASQTFGLTLDAAAVASLNADVPLLLSPGAMVQVPGGSAIVQLHDTLATLAARNQLQPSTLATFGTNATAPILAPTGIVQFHPDSLVRVAAIPAGSAGFQLTRPNPDPGNTKALTAMDGPTILAELFHMLGHRIVQNESGVVDFRESGEGIPAGPSQSKPTENGGAPPPDLPNPQWDYHHAIAIAPFAFQSFGSASPALPAAASNPYAGTGPDANVTFAFDFHDPFGNTLPLPAPGTLPQPVRYFDDITGVAQWPSSAIGYSIDGNGSADPSLTLRLSLHLQKYLTNATLSSVRAARNIATDVKTYLRAYYQTSQPDVGFSLSTTLDPDGQGKPVNHALPILPFREFVMGAWVVLDALSATEPVVSSPQNATTSIGSVAGDFDVALADLFNANGAALYSTVFAQAELTIPKLYTTVAGDSLSSIAKAQNINVDDLARQNPWATLSTTIDLEAGPRTVPPETGDSLASIAGRFQCSVSGLATSNSEAPLTNDLQISVAGIGVTTNGDSFSSLVTKFTGLSVTIPEIAIANQTIPGIFQSPASLTIHDIVPLAGDSLGSLEQRFTFTVQMLAEANQDLANLYATGTSLYIGSGEAVPAPGDGATLAQFAAQNNIPLPALGLALYDGLQPANPPAVNGNVLLAESAKLTIPATVTNNGVNKNAPYRALSSDVDIATIAAKFDANPAVLGKLNVDLPNLFLAGIDVGAGGSNQKIKTDENSTFASLVNAFAAIGVTVTPESLAQDNATAKLVRPTGLWLCPPMIAIAANNGKDTLASIATRYGMVTPDGKPDVARVARTNAAVKGFIAPDVTLNHGGKPFLTNLNTTFNALIGIFTDPGGTAPSIDDLAAAFADVALVPANALVLPCDVESVASVTITPSFSSPIVRVGVTVTETRSPDWIADAFKDVSSVSSSTFDVPPLTTGDGDGQALSLDAFATAVETAIPGVWVATGDPAIETDDASQRRLWLVNFERAGTSPLEFHFLPSSLVRSFAIPPLSTSLASGTALVTPYVSGQGLSGTAQPLTFASIDLDVWGAQFLAAMDLMLSPIYAVPASEGAPEDLETIIAAKRTLAASISGRVQYVMDGGGPGEHGGEDPRRAEAIAVMGQELLVTLSSAYTINSLVQAAVKVASPFTDPVTAPRLSGKPTLNQPDSSTSVRNASLSNAKVPLAQTTESDPALATFLLTVQSPAQQRSTVADLSYAVAEIEIPAGPPDPDGYQSSSWLTLVHPLDDTNGKVPGVTLPIPLRAYPLPPTLVSQKASASFPDDPTVDQVYRWEANVVYSHQDADQDTGRLKLEVGVPLGTGDNQSALNDSDPIFLALAQFFAVYPALKTDLALLTQLAPGSAPSPVTTKAVTAFATIAFSVAAAWPTNAIVPSAVRRFASRELSTEIVPGVYAYSLTHTGDTSDLLELDLIADADNTATLWPTLFVNTTGKDTDFDELSFISSSGATARYRYPRGVKRGLTLQYKVSLARAQPATTEIQNDGLAKLDIVMIADINTSVAVDRNADLIEGETTCPLFVYSAPYTTFSSPLVPLLLVTEDFDIGPGQLNGLESALQTFLTSLLHRPAAPSGSTRTLRLNAGFGYELVSVIAAGADNVDHVPKSITTFMPVVLVPSVELTINGDSTTGTDISAFALNLSNFIVDWDSKVKPSHTKAAVVFELTLFSTSEDSENKPLLEMRSVRYLLTDK
jgi:LysM repeat protein